MIDPCRGMTDPYQPNIIEQKWQRIWRESAAFKVSEPLEADFSIALPPPNVTGNLHMGHALNCTLQDILIRYQRLQGKTVHWQIGCDHAGIGTQIVVEKNLAARGINKHSLGPEKFEEIMWEWTEKHKSRIQSQLQTLGCSADFSRAAFTLDASYVESVRKAFFELFREGAVYQGRRLINWCPVCQTSISDLEVVHEDRPAKLYQIKYIIDSENSENIDSENFLIVATSRPETLFGDVAVAINPQDQRYTTLISKLQAGQNITLKLPLTNKQIPLTLSKEVKLDFGTGALKITPAHDFNDANIARELQITDSIQIFNEKAEILALDFIAEEFHGLGRFEAREKVLEKLAESGLLIGEEEYTQSASCHDRCGNLIEPHFSKQWFVRTKPLAKLAIDALDQGKVRFHPARYSKTYLDWLENIQDWCISRQLWWGHRIPVWQKKFPPNISDNTPDMQSLHKELINEFRRMSIESGYQNTLKSDLYHPTFATGKASQGREYILQFTEESVQVVLLKEDPDLEQKLKKHNYIAETDVLDTWFSSALWPYATQGWGSSRKAHTSKKQWTNVLSTAREIINLWISRMIFSSIELTDKLPFSDVLIHPVIQTPDGRRMSKSKGNVIDPLEMIELYGADASRLFYGRIGISSNQDYKFPGKKEKDGSWSSSTIEDERRFINKLWNACKFVQGIPENPQSTKAQSQSHNIWIKSLWSETLNIAQTALDKYDFALYVESLRGFVWGEYCDWYLEFAKLNPSQETSQTAIYILKEVVKALHPVIPFVTEELWSYLSPDHPPLYQQSWPHKTHSQSPANLQRATEIQQIKQIVQEIRSIRQNILGISANRELDILLDDESCFGDIEWARLARVKINLTGNSNDYHEDLVTIRAKAYSFAFQIVVPSDVGLSARIKVLRENLKKTKDKIIKLEKQLDNPYFQRREKEFAASWQEFRKLQEKQSNVYLAIAEIESLCL